MRPDRRYSFFRISDLGILLFTVIIFLILGSGGPSPGTGRLLLEIHNGEGTVVHPMPSDTLLQVEGNMGELEVLVEGSRARISSSPCPGQDCVRQGWLSRPGDMAVCVPSGVFIVLVPEGSFSPDAVSY